MFKKEKRAAWQAVAFEMVPSFTVLFELFFLWLTGHCLFFVAKVDHCAMGRGGVGSIKNRLSYRLSASRSTNRDQSDPIRENQTKTTTTTKSVSKPKKRRRRPRPPPPRRLMATPSGNFWNALFDVVYCPSEASGARRRNNVQPTLFFGGGGGGHILGLGGGQMWRRKERERERERERV